ncbi:F-box/FBD/LRR-repeat protein At1g13570 [Lactuca sativa]|uniref:F-box domain-containing protein n=1 Tax=Lactuca sativa TaxID=4236 RepID=A0A9R1WFD6_LACSA|nr:F-box/FBD/LRR-repeat protein At1g13570 [Lactuca sativa]XP_023731544.1 F-box/FBD/LRR-repeat protein At1g13570 [Lactuca sativa]KAJ0224210.1 hypothetical protein LSAT_V11C100032560 [Lactuca sativa]
MTENYRAGIVTCAKEDRISNLPEHLIDSILERVPLEEAVRTSILSKNWRYRWTTMKELVFDQQFSKKFAKNGAFGHNGFIRIVNKVLFFHKGPILKFHVHVPNMFLDNFEEVDQWVLFLSRNGVNELLLNNSNRRSELPSYLFCCLELTKLELHKCCFKPPLEFEGFLNLEKLRLEDIDFGARLCGTKFNLPQLKKLSLLKCTNVYNFNIKATRLQELIVYACHDAMLLRLLDSPCLLLVSIAFEKPIEDFVRVEEMNLATMLSNLSKVEYFYINSYFLKFLIAEKIPKLLPGAISSLKHLWLLDIQLGDLNQLHAVLCFLRNSPNLEKLFVRHFDMDPRVDVGPASDHLESPNCLDSTLDQLKIVEMTCLKGSKPELLFIKLLLAHSPSLQKFTIKPSRASDVQKRYDIAKEVMQFPRASTKAKMFFFDPEP